MPNHSNFRLRGIACYIALAISGGSVNAWADDSIQFDPRFLELKGDTKIDLGKFSKKGYVDAGKYNLRVFINKQPLSDEYDINWYVSENDPTKNYACLTPELVAALGLKEGIAKSLQWTHNDECLKPGQLDGMEVENDLSQSALLLTVPQAYLEYTSSDWDPPSRWDDGIPGLIADYSLNAQTRHQEQGGEDSHDISGNGTVGANLGAWRFRADWQSDYQHTRSNDDDDDSSNSTTSKNWDWSRYYAWRALPSLKAKLSLGEDYLNSDIFDGFNYIGSSVSTDDQMLPPNLRGYAPDVSGVAHSSAKVTISQMGRVLYETQVPAGPFRIQDIGDSVSGTLHVRVEEQNGQVQEYDVTTASMPFLTRQGQVRYKVMMACWTCSASCPSGRCSRIVNLVVRSTSVPIALLLRLPVIRSPSQCPGTARSSISAGRSLIMTMGSRNRGLRPPSPCGLRLVRPCLMARFSSCLSSPLACR